jgi:hypothetical protein
MDVNRAVAIAARTGRAELRRLYAVAVARGANNMGCSAEVERADGSLRLLTLALVRLPDLALCAHLLDLVDEREEDPVVARATSDVAAGAVRLADRALEIHGREVGYQTGAWVDVALGQTGARLGSQATAVDDDAPVALDEARSATLALTRATAATASDRMLVSEQLAVGLGHLLAIFAIARAAGG